MCRGFTVMSHGVSRGHMATLVGKRFWAGRLSLDSCLVCIHFSHAQDHHYVLYWCGVPLALCGWLVSACYHQKKGKRGGPWLNVARHCCKQWGGRRFQQLSTVFCRHFISSGFYCNTYQHILVSYITESITTGCILCCKENKRTLPPTACKHLAYVTPAA